MGVVFTSLSLGSFFAKEVTELPFAVAYAQFQNGDAFFFTLVEPSLPTLLVPGLRLFHRSNNLACNLLGVFGLTIFSCWLCPSTGNGLIIFVFACDSAFIVDVATGLWTERADVFSERVGDDDNIIMVIVSEIEENLLK
jgi:hypothetical protein